MRPPSQTRLIAIFAIIGITGSVAPAQGGSRLSRRFEQFDCNGDGVVTADEVPRGSLIDRFDGNSDGSVSREEFRESFDPRRRDRSSVDRSWTPATFKRPVDDLDGISEASILAAAEYSARHDGVSFLVMHDGDLVYEDYPNGGGRDRSHALASGTKSFNAALACVAIADGWLRWDEPASDTLTEWRDDPAKSLITVRQLLNLTSGLDPKSRTRRKVPDYASAIGNPVRTAPGTSFDYGPVPFQCFGELMKRKLAAAGQPADPLAYLERRILDPIGMTVDRWRRDQDGNSHLPSGAFLTAGQWAKFGELIRREGNWNGRVVLPTDELRTCFEGTGVNPAYGTTFWLNRPISPDSRRQIRALRFAVDDLSNIPVVPADVRFAAGAGGQRMYVIPSLKLTVVRQAEGAARSASSRGDRFADGEFLKRLLAAD